VVKEIPVLSAGEGNREMGQAVVMINAAGMIIFISVIKEAFFILLTFRRERLSRSTA
jgi:hypothetical protein